MMFVTGRARPPPKKPDLANSRVEATRPPPCLTWTFRKEVDWMDSGALWGWIGVSPVRYRPAGATPPGG